MTIALPVARAAPVDSEWRRPLLALGVAAAAILLLFRSDVAHMASIWWNSSTFNHCLLIPFIIAWLVAQRSSRLRGIAPGGWLPGLAIVAAGSLSWMIGEAGGVALARHAGLIVMLQGMVIAMLGKAAARALAFPIFYALFLIPLGEELVPAMQTVTARITTFLLVLSGVPAFLQGIFITTPTGFFEVAEACAGVKFLVAMIAFGTLVANVCFRAWPRRIAFLALSAAIPILANGVRAWGTIFVAHHVDPEFAAGFDHVVYGGIFFALVIALTLAAGWRFFDRDPADPEYGPVPVTSRTRPAGVHVVAGVGLALVLLPLLWSAAIAGSGRTPAPDFALPAIRGWEALAVRSDWRPHFAGADLMRVGRYRDGAGREVDLAIAVFARQDEGRELVGFGQGAANAGNGWTWMEDAPAPPNGRAERIVSRGLVREVVSFYRIGDSVTGSGARVKFETMKSRLLGGPQRAVAVLVSAEGAAARGAIDDFLVALGPVDRIADRAAGLD